MKNTPPPPPFPDQLDDAWKCALDCLFRECLALCFPAIAAALDLARPMTVLDGELHQPSNGCAPGAAAWHADRVVRCYARDGTPLIVHLEVQCQREAHFARRMYIYHALLFARYRLPVLSLAILGDACASWRPALLAYGYPDCELHFRFATCKLLDFAPFLQALLAAKLPFALFVAAHLETMQTKREPLARLAAKCRLTEILCGYGWESGRVAQMLELLDRLMLLTPDQDKEYRRHLELIEGKHMLTLSQRIKRDAIRRGLERGAAFGILKGSRIGLELGLEQGLEQGRERGLVQGLDQGRKSLLAELIELRFGPQPPHIAERLQNASPDEVRRLTTRICDAASLEELLG